MDDSKFMKVAKQAAIAAGEIVKKYSGKEHEYHTKTHVHDFATEADLESEKIILEIIKKEFPEHAILAEESGVSGGTSEYKWAIDPIDGTIQFDSGMPFYSVSIGLLKNDQPILGVINHVAAGDLYSAEEGKGAFVNGQKISVSQRKLENSSLILDFGRHKRMERVKDRFAPFAEIARYIYALGGAAVELCFLSRGFADGFIHRASLWDYAAGAVILKEAGGKLTNFEGGEVDWSQTKVNLIASNGLIHEDLVRIFNSKS